MILIGTVHFELAIALRGIKREWCEQVVANPVATEVQANGRIRYWGFIEEHGHYLRVVVLEDGETFHTATWDRNFGKKVKT